MITRRTLLAAAAATPAALALPARAQALREFRIGYQKNGILVVAKQQRAIENRLKPLGVEVKWIEFSFGPPLLEALNIGSIDFGTTGDAPPIFAQAAGREPPLRRGPARGGSGAAILLPKGSTIQSLADLKGKRVAFAKASSAHNLTVAALEKAGLAYKDIQPLTSPPPTRPRPSRAAASMPGRSGTPTSPSPRRARACGSSPSPGTSSPRTPSSSPTAPSRSDTARWCGR